VAVTRSQRDYPSREQLTARVADDFGAGARILAVDEVLVGGVAGFFAQRRYRVTVETGHGEPDIAASRDTLLSLVEAAEAGDRVTMSTAPAAAPAPPPVVVAERPRSAERPRVGDLVAVVGLAVDLVEADLPVRLGWGAPVVVTDAQAGADDETRRTWRRGLVRRRAESVLERNPTLLIAPLRGASAAAMVRTVIEAEPDEVIVVVDCSRKPADTQSWVASLRSGASPTGMLVTGADRTASPGSVDALRIPRVAVQGTGAPRRLVWV
jgi:hypothetical protein